MPNTPGESPTQGVSATNNAAVGNAEAAAAEAQAQVAADQAAGATQSTASNPALDPNLQAYLASLDPTTRASVETYLASVNAKASVNAASPNAVTGTDPLTGLPALSGTALVPSLIPSLPPNASDAQEESAAMAYYNAHPEIQQQIINMYGYIGAYLLSVPELAPILITAGLEGWGQAQFDGAITETNWWKTSSQAQRNFQELQIQDPGEAAQQVSQMKDTILSESQSLGIPMTDQQVSAMALSAVEYNWGSAVIEQTMRTTYSSPSAAPAFGASATFADAARAAAGAYGINMSDAELAQYVQQNQQGKLTADGLQAQFEQQASQLYPWASTALAQGTSLSQYLSNWSQAAGSTLGVDPSTIRWTDPKWTKALLTNPDGSTAEAPVNIGVFQQNLMKDPTYGYQNTQNARDQAYATVNQIETTLGAVKR